MKRDNTDMPYDLSRLGSIQFERLVQGLLSGTFGIPAPPFARGHYGERESSYHDRLAWPADARRGAWEGATVVEVQFLSRSSNQQESYDWLARRVEETDERWRMEVRRRRVSRGEEPLPEYLILVTNLPLVGASRRDLDSLLRAFSERNGLTDFAFWGYDDLCRMLDNQNEVRQEFYGFISTGDTLRNLHEAVSDLTPEFSDLISRHVAMELTADQWVRLTQAGDTMHGKLPLSQLVIDLPLQPSGTDRYAAQYIIGEGNRVLRRSITNDDRPHIVILGGPGQGKTTIGQLACQAYRAVLLTDASWLGSDGIGLLRSTQEGLSRIGLPIPVYRRWPIRIELSAYADAATSSKRMSLLRYICEQINLRTSDEIPPTSVRTWLRVYPWLLVLDGLDEVASAVARDTLTERVSEFLIEAEKEDADLFIVVTTRPQGYTGEFSPDQYTHLTLDSLAPSQAAAYARRLAGVRHADDPDMCRKLVDRTEVAAAEESTARLMRSPLQVTIMSLLLEGRERAPQARYSLFESYYETIYAREAAKPGTVGRLLQEQRSHINALHDRVGLLLQVDSEKDGGADASVPQSQLKELTVKRLLAEGHLPTNAEALGDEIVNAVTSRLVLIVPKALDDVAFEIRSIQEFFAARAMVSGGDASVIDRLRKTAPAIHWRNTWLFAAGRVFAQREHLRLNLIALLSEIDATDMLSFVVAPGADLALDLLDDDLTISTPRLQRMLGNRALALLDYPPDQDLGRRALVLFRNADRDIVIRTAAEKALARAFKATPAQAKSASIICRIWRKQEGYLAMASRKLLTSQPVTSSSHAPDPQRRHAKDTIAVLVRQNIENAQLSARDRNIAGQLLGAFRKVRLLPENVDLDAASVLASDRAVSRKVKDLCFSNPDIANAVAAAAIDAAADTWVGASELRNMLRVWQQRQSVGDQVLEVTPFTDTHDDQA
jgi:hypothetical protein